MRLLHNIEIKKTCHKEDSNITQPFLIQQYFSREYLIALWKAA